jgi:hypothetical protein
LAALRGALGGLRECRGSFGWRHFRGRLNQQERDGIEQFTTMTKGADTNSFKSSAVRLCRTLSSISFSRNAASYCPKASELAADIDGHALAGHGS